MKAKKYKGFFSPALGRLLKDYFRDVYRDVSSYALQRLRGFFFSIKDDANMNSKITNALLSVVVFLLGVVGYFGKQQIDELQKTRDLMVDVRLELVDQKSRTQANASAITDHENRLRDLEKTTKGASAPVKPMATLPGPVGGNNWPPVNDSSFLFSARHEEYLSFSDKKSTNY